MKENKPKQVEAKPLEKKPVPSQKTNEQYGFHFSSSLKISDPESGKVILQMRCD